jgi:hypothetical protein
MMTTAHEIGHWLDGVMLPVGILEVNNASSREAKAVVDFWTAIYKTNATQELTKLVREGGTVKIKIPTWEVVDGKPTRVEAIQDVPSDEDFVRYLSKDNETWARAYAQYVATRSSNPVLKAELVKAQEKIGYPQQWSDEDFTPVADAIDNLFKTMGWLE